MHGKELVQASIPWVFDSEINMQPLCKYSDTTWPHPSQDMYLQILARARVCVLFVVATGADRNRSLIGFFSAISSGLLLLTGNM